MHLIRLLISGSIKWRTLWVLAMAVFLLSSVDLVRASDPPRSSRDSEFVEGGLLLRVPLSDGGISGNEPNFLDFGPYGYIRSRGEISGVGGALRDTETIVVVEPRALFRFDFRTGRLERVELGVGGSVRVEDVRVSSGPLILVDRRGSAVAFDARTLIPIVNGLPADEAVARVAHWLRPSPESQTLDPNFVSQLGEGFRQAPDLDPCRRNRADSGVLPGLPNYSRVLAQIACLPSEEPARRGANVESGAFPLDLRLKLSEAWADFILDPHSGIDSLNLKLDSGPRLRLTTP